MAIYGKATNSDIFFGGSCVATGDDKPQSYIPSGSFDAMYWASGEGILSFDVLNGRYNVKPTGWSS